MRRTTIALAAMLALGASAALADNENKAEGTGGFPVGPTGNLMTSGVNPIYHPWMVLGRGPIASRARETYGSEAYGSAGSSYGYAGNSFASEPTSRGRRVARPRTLGYGFGTYEEEDPPGLLPAPPQ